MELCELGDKTLLEDTSKVFKKEKEMKKGTIITIIYSSVLFEHVRYWTMIKYVYKVPTICTQVHVIQIERYSIMIAKYMCR